MNNKFRAIKTEVSGILFDSKFESQTYESLKRIFSTNCFQVKTQYPILIKPKTLGFAAVYWRCDFCILKDGKPLVYIESKGTLTRDFKLLMKFLEYRNPDLYSRIILVISKTSEIRSYSSLKLHTIKLDRDFSSNIHKFFQGK